MIPSEVRTSVNIVEEYWSGVSQRLQTEVDVLNRLVQHNAELGRANELAVANILKEILPSSLGVGTGIIIDSSGRRSLQTDIILFERSKQPQILAQTTQLIFPVETVVMALEVKTTMDADAVKDVGDKCASIRALVDSRGVSGPALGLFAYHCSGAPASIGRGLRDLPDDRRPDLMCVTNPGLVGYTSALTGKGEVHFVPLHKRNDNNERVSQSWQVPAQDYRGSYIQAGESLYPIARLTPRGHDRTVFDPGRALLLFCSALLTQLTNKSVMEENWLEHYLSGLALETISVPEASS